MVYSLKFFCDFLEADSLDSRKKLVRQYKRGKTERSKGMMVYYSPALQLMKSRFCPDETLSERLSVLRERCVIGKWTEKLNDARIEANTAVFKQFYSHFGNKQMRILSSPRLKCDLNESVAISVQPDLYAEMDGVVMVWKFNMTRKARSEKTARYILHMLDSALKQRGLTIPIEHICYMDLRSGRLYLETAGDGAFLKKLGPLANAISEAWEAAA